MKAIVFALALYFGLTAAAPSPYHSAIDAAGDLVTLDDLVITNDDVAVDFANDVDRAAISDAFDTNLDEDIDGDKFRAPEYDAENFGFSRAAITPDQYDKHAFVAAKAINQDQCKSNVRQKAEEQCKSKFKGDDNKKCVEEAKKAEKLCLDGVRAPCRKNTDKKCEQEYKKNPEMQKKCKDAFRQLEGSHGHCTSSLPEDKPFFTVFTYPPVKISKTFTTDKECMANGNTAVFVEWCYKAFGVKGLNDGATQKNCEDDIDKIIQECRKSVADKKKKKYDYKFDLQKVKQGGPGLPELEIPPRK
ncbi:hypothetical protein HDU96_008103 [Phlyctochytrium bullatum]|nr:hypothetical protein HDU96_008103 [Phlyctochytrium bullatum]